MLLINMKLIHGVSMNGYKKRREDAELDYRIYSALPNRQKQT
jgi:hypothetical protein